MRSRHFALLLAVLVVLLGSIAVDAQVRKSNAWVKRDRANEAQNVEFHVALKQQNMQYLEQIALQVSDPASPAYGKHLTNEQVSRIVALPETDIQSVLQWINERMPSASVKLSGHKDYIIVNAPVHAVQTALDCKLFNFESKRIVGRTSATKIVSVIRSDVPVAIPEDINAHVEMLVGIHDFPSPQLKPLSTQFFEPGQTVNPPIIRSYYNVTAQGNLSPHTSQGLAEFEQEYFYPSDITTFQQKYNLPQKAAKIIGKNDPNTGYLGEATLDVEYAFAMAPHADTWVWSFDAYDLVAWAVNVTSTPNAPKVHSVSYGTPEASYDAAFLKRTNSEFMKMATQGYSIMVASGDYGTGNTAWGPWCGPFSVYFPASSNWVTAVGGTYLTKQHSQIAWPGSGGGFSNAFPRPSWQSSVVATYLTQQGLPPTEYWNNTGRAVPDVSAFSTNFEVCTENYWGVISGTSAASPTFAGIITLLNDYRLSKGLPTLGFLNPWLYKVNDIGLDITDGSNPAEFCSKGFPATDGWDAVTGLGTPIFSKLMAALPPK